MAYLSFRVVEKLVMVRRRKRSLVKSEEGWYFLFPLIFLLRAFIGKIRSFLILGLFYLSCCRGFWHEKTKKKRGTYRGGQIDLQTHSIKFDNSDDE